MIRIFTDTSANLPADIIKNHNIGVVPFTYIINGKETVPDGAADFDGKSYYNLVRAGADVKTSMISPGLMESSFRECLENGDDVLYVGMSGGISGTAQNARNVVNELKEEFPERQIEAIDTFAASLGEGLQVLKAAQMFEGGVSFKDTVNFLLDFRNNMCQYFTVDDLKYLKRGGRISSAAAAVGTLLNIKPILKGDAEGHIVSCGKARGNRAALKTLAEKFGELASDKKELVGIAHADNEEGAAELLSNLKSAGFKGKCLTVCYEPVTGAHVGPGTVALFFPGIHK